MAIDKDFKVKNGLITGGNVSINSTSSLGYRLRVAVGSGNGILVDGASTAGYSHMTLTNDTSKSIVITASGSIAAGWTQNNCGIGTVSNDPLLFGSNNTERMRLSAAGNFGIGTTSPQTTLHVSNFLNSVIRLGGVAATDWTHIGRSSTESFFYTADAQPITFYTNATIRSQITSGGDITIGTINAGATSGSGVMIPGSAGTTYFRHIGATPGKFRFIGGDGANAFVCYNNSNVGMYMADNGTVWLANSDERLKTDLVPITNAISKVSTLRTVTGRYKTDEVNVSRAFLIAQDVIKVLPEAVSTNKMPGDDTDYLGVGYSDLIPLALAAIKEQQVIIEFLITRIIALEAK